MYFGSRGVSTPPRRRELTLSPPGVSPIVTDGHRTWKGLGISPYARTKEFSLWPLTPFALPPEVLPI